MQPRYPNLDWIRKLFAEAAPGAAESPAKSAAKSAAMSLALYQILEKSRLTVQAANDCESVAQRPCRPDA
jgi:hypothetical protein